MYSKHVTCMYPFVFGRVGGVSNMFALVHPLLLSKAKRI